MRVFLKYASYDKLEPLISLYKKEEEGRIQQPVLEGRVAEIKLCTGCLDISASQFPSIVFYKTSQVFIELFQVAMTEMFYHKRDHITGIPQEIGNDADIGAI